MWNRLKLRYDRWKFNRKVKKAGGWGNFVNNTFPPGPPPIIDIANQMSSQPKHNWTTKPWYPFEAPTKDKDDDND